MWRLSLLAVLALAACHDKLPREYYPDAAPGSCGGVLPPCPDDEYCAYPEDNCGYLSYGTCAPRPTRCPAGGPPVCVCGFEIYASACEALQAGKGLSAHFQCTPPSGQFQCGYEICNATQYCQRADGAARCVDAPATCTDGVTCACLADEPCGASCAPFGDGHVVTTCP